jgi:hypothetical protein
MVKSNAEKQARFRKKQKLEKYKEEAFKEWQLKMNFGPRRETPSQVHALLEKATTLPSGWTDKDIEKAWDRINKLRIEFMHPLDELKKDVQEGAGWTTEAMINASHEVLSRAVSDGKKSLPKVIALSQHLISALELSALSNSGQAAAIMEAVRYIGRAAMSSGDMAKSNAMAVCHASLTINNDRPDWFLNSLVNWLGSRLDQEGINELAKRLAEYRKEEIL